MDTSASLIERLRRPPDEAAGAEAWSRFVQLYTPLLYSWARRVGLQPADAADLVQDVFTVLVGKLPEFKYDLGKRFRGWLWTVTLNKFRENRRRKSLPIAGAADSDLPDPAAEDPAVELSEAEYRRYLVQRMQQRCSN
jgi:RNA polymerase sigma-70 factor, ECF subfamily